MANLEFNHAGSFPGETKKRSLVKTIIYRVLIILADFAFLYILTHKFTLSVVVMVGSNLYTALGYYFYERAWNRIKWGRTVEKKNPGKHRRKRRHS